MGDLEQATSLGVSIAHSTTNILLESPEDDVLDGVYSLLEELESVLLCGSVCGQDPILILVTFYFYFYFFNNFDHNSSLSPRATTSKLVCLQMF